MSAMLQREDEMNVSSIVIRTLPEYLVDVIEGINAIELCEVHFYNSEGKIVATIEGNSVQEQIEHLRQIQGMPNVFSANLMYSCFSDDAAPPVQMRDGLRRLQE